MKTYAGEGTLAEFSRIVKGAISQAGGGTGAATYLLRAPVCTIVIWSGTADNIPTGWQLCDGTNGTPDLRDKFVLGAGTTHAVGETGGEETHVLSVAEMPSHSHIQRMPNMSNQNNLINMTYASGSQNISRYEASSASGRSNSPVTTANNGSSQSHNNMPPYYTLCYIMKLTADLTDGVLSINEETGAITLAAGDNVSIEKTGKTITISATGDLPKEENARNAANIDYLSMMVNVELPGGETDAQQEI